MFTENIILALIASASLLTIVLVSIFVIRFGLRIECGWLYFRILTAPKPELPVLSKAEIENEIRKVVQDTLKVQLTALDSYKDNINRIDEAMRAVLAQRLADTSIIPDKTTDAKLINLAVRMELLLINTENHYTQVSTSINDLELYIMARYRRIYGMLSRYDVNVPECAYRTISLWWDTLHPTLVDTIKNKIVCSTKMASISAGLIWEDSFTKESEQAKERLHVLTACAQIDDLLCRHQCYVPNHNKGTSELLNSEHNPTDDDDDNDNEVDNTRKERAKDSASKRKKGNRK